MLIRSCPGTNASTVYFVTACTWTPATEGSSWSGGASAAVVPQLQLPAARCCRQNRGQHAGMHASGGSWFGGTAAAAVAAWCSVVAAKTGGSTSACSPPAPPISSMPLACRLGAELLRRPVAVCVWFQLQLTRGPPLPGCAASQASAEGCPATAARTQSASTHLDTKFWVGCGVGWGGSGGGGVGVGGVGGGGGDGAMEAWLWGVAEAAGRRRYVTGRQVSKHATQWKYDCLVCATAKRRVPATNLQLTIMQHQGRQRRVLLQALQSALVGGCVLRGRSTAAPCRARQLPGRDEAGSTMRAVKLERHQPLQRAAGKQAVCVCRSLLAGLAF